MTFGWRMHRLAAGCAGVLLGAGLALGAVPVQAAAGPTRLPAASALEVEHGGSTLERVGGVPSGPAAAATAAAGSHDSVESPLATATGAYQALSPSRLLDTRTTGQTLAANGSLNLTVTGGSVPAGATAVALNVTATDTTASSYLSVYPAGQTRPVLSNLNWVAGETVPNLVIVPIGSGGQVTFYNYQGRADVVVDLEGYFAPEPSGTTAGSYVPLTPARITDTRPGSGEPNSGDTLAPGSTLDVQVAGVGGVPVTGAGAALLNVTVTDTTSSSFLAVYPQGTAYPGSSNLNWLGGETVANRVVVPVGTSGEVELFNNAGSTDVVVDVDGYFTNGSSTPTTASLFSPITPVRVLDTRNTTGQTLGPGATLTQAMAGVDGIASNASAVVTNVTATDTTAASFFTVYPGGTMPLASDVNWGPGQTVPNLTVASLSGTGTMDVYNHSGSADLVIDAFGYFAPETSGGTEPQTVTFSTSAPTDAQVGDGSYTPAATATSGLSATITLDATSTGCALASGVVSFTSNGTCVLDANQPGNATYAAAPQVQQSFAVSGGATSIGSSNWSGYAVTSGPYSSVTGTFTVPSLVDPPANVSVSEWVGIDGAVAGDNWVIQAGVDEQQGCGSFCVIPWWEIITPSDEAPATEITDVTVDAGDEVTVTINQVSGTTWDISLTDDTNRQEFSNEFLYTGPATSAEWIVEDPSGYAGDGGGLYPFSDYTTTTFSDLGFTGAEAGLTEVILIQSGEQLSTPSAWTGLATGFAVAYGDVAPPPP